jgi:putative membrane protein
MFLPGISGSFILLIIGTYEYIINAIHNIQSNISQLITFTTGLILGMYFISRIISYLYKKDKSKTLYTLFGLIIGALSIPIKNSIISLPEITPLYLSILLGFVIE